MISANQSAQAESLQIVYLYHILGNLQFSTTHIQGSPGRVNLCFGRGSVYLIACKGFLNQGCLGVVAELRHNMCRLLIYGVAQEFKIDANWSRITPFIAKFYRVTRRTLNKEKLI